jgi:putative tricarboxylic transport membrane protein
MANILGAFSIAANAFTDPYSLLLLLIATTAGVIIGMIPGLGSVVALALFIPLTFGLDPLVAFMVLAAVNGGVSQGGSVSAILLNTPGYSPNAATLLDGYPMTREGRANEALGASATASALGAIVGISVLALSIPILIELVLLFGPPEIFWLGILGITIVSAVVGDRIISGLISGSLGLMFAMYGLNGVTAGHRWTFGIPSLLDGIPLIPPLIGLFAVSEMMDLAAKGETIADEDVDIGTGKWDGVKSVFVHKWLFLRSALIGTVTGIVPGVGGTTANFVAYFQAEKTAKNSETFGTGDIRGVIASEASNDGKEGGGYIPTLGFGIPGSASMVVLLTAFLLHGIQPGPLLIQDHLDVVAVIIIAGIISNIVSSAVVISLSERLVKVTTIDIRVLFPIVLAFTLIAAYADGNNIFFIWIALVFGLFGFLMKKVNMSRVPMILGFVLSPIVETNFFRSLQISGDQYLIFTESIISKLLILLVVLSLFYPYIQRSVERLVARGVRE